MEEGDAWAKFSVPGTECSRFPAKRLEAERKRVGDLSFRQEYMCEFVAMGQQLFDPDLLNGALDDGPGLF